MAKYSDQDFEKLLAEVKELKEQAESERKMRTAAEERAESIASASFAMRTAEAQPTGKTVLMKKCTNPEVRDAKKHNWIEIEVPTYFYLIDLPPGACGSNGSCISTNGIEYHHGTTVELDQFSLADVMSRVARTWDHERSIHSSNEANYKKHVSAKKNALGIH